MPTDLAVPESPRRRLRRPAVQRRRRELRGRPVQQRLDHIRGVRLREGARASPSPRSRTGPAYYTQPTAQAVAIALQGARINPDGTQVLKGVYEFSDNPRLPGVQLQLHDRATTTESAPFSAEEGTALGKFILYFLCAGQQKAEQLGYSPLPKNLVQLGFDAVTRIPGAPTPPPIDSCSNPTITGNFITGAGAPATIPPPAPSPGTNSGGATGGSADGGATATTAPPTAGGATTGGATTGEATTGGATAGGATAEPAAGADTPTTGAAGSVTNAPAAGSSGGNAGSGGGGSTVSSGSLDVPVDPDSGAVVDDGTAETVPVDPGLPPDDLTAAAAETLGGLGVGADPITGVPVAAGNNPAAASSIVVGDEPADLPLALYVLIAVLAVFGIFGVPALGSRIERRRQSP